MALVYIYPKTKGRKYITSWSTTIQISLSSQLPTSTTITLTLQFTTRLNLNGILLRILEYFMTYSGPHISHPDMQIPWKYTIFPCLGS